MSQSSQSNALWTQPHLYWAVLLFATLVIAVATFRDYGVSWDEPFRAQGGEKKLRYYQAVFSGDFETAQEVRPSEDHYPGLFDLSLAILKRISPLDDISTTHLWSAAFGVLGILGTMLLANTLGGPWAGLAAGLLLALYPRYWGHMFINPKDIPFAATFVWGLWAIARTVYSKNPYNLRLAFTFGVCAGACMAVRVGGLLLFCYAGLFIGIFQLAQWFTSGRNPKAFVQPGLRLSIWLLTAGAIAGSILFVFWPKIHISPFQSTSSTLAEVRDFGWQGTIFFSGEYLNVSEIPWHYLVTWLSITAPDLWLILGLLGCGLFIFKSSKVDNELQWLQATSGR